MKASVFLLPFFCGMAVALGREYIYINTTMNWTDAQKYCTQNYGGLATITTDEEIQKLKMIAENFTQAWIGLYRSPVNKNIWLWSYGQKSVLFRQSTMQPNNYKGVHNCVAMTPYGGIDLECEKSLPFFCNMGMDILVKEKKTWEGALDYCRILYTGFSSMSQLHLAENDIKQIQADSVWTGLCFLSGNWLWVSEEMLGIPESLPACPTPPYHCGAYNFKTNVWENRNCNEKLNFLCY